MNESGDHDLTRFGALDHAALDHAALGNIAWGNVAGLVEFAAVARWEHVTRAATQLGVPQSTLSRRIARLEAAVDVPLFMRRGRRLELTRDGRAFAVIVDRALQELERGLDELTRNADPESGTVVLAFLHTLGAEVVPRVLKEFRAVHPRIRFQLSQDGHDVGVAKLRRGEVDICLTSPLPEDPALSSFALHQQRLCLAVPAGHPLDKVDALDLAHARGEQFIGFKPGYGLRRISDAWCREAGFVPMLAFEGEDVATVRGLVAAGLGVALVPVSTVAPAGLVEVPVGSPPATRTIGMAWRTDHQLSPPVEAFRDFMLERGAELARV